MIYVSLISEYLKYQQNESIKKKNRLGVLHGIGKVHNAFGNGIVMLGSWEETGDIFIWLVLHNRLKIKAEILRRHIQIGSVCDRCGTSVEDTLHVIRDCLVAKRLWNRVIPMSHRQSFYSWNLREWMIHNLRSSRKLKRKLNWSCFFGIAIWRLWFWRNQFQLNHMALDTASMINDILMRTKEIHHLNNSPLHTGINKVEKWIGWSAPIWPWCKLNTDGACKRLGEASTGGLIRDFNGKWMTGFGMNIVACYVTLAELWVLYQVLNMAWNIGYRWLYVEVDSLCVTQLIANPVLLENEFSPLIRSIKELTKRDWNIIISHIYREVNFSVDYRSSYAATIPLRFHYFHSCWRYAFIIHDVYWITYLL